MRSGIDCLIYAIDSRLEFQLINVNTSIADLLVGSCLVKHIEDLHLRNNCIRRGKSRELKLWRERVCLDCICGADQAPDCRHFFCPVWMRDPLVEDISRLHNNGVGRSNRVKPFRFRFWIQAHG
ncbi:PREDICTED: uncharacterized protein LOC105961732 [Erythranthe guttata]|uniref:uncharacterized protein LOC105961732 n=1 Tax=Erythranthe guttata TaxID=4155 RepID=UPI00064D84B6|nr:PREDICTED: uncharacterized protein LOC105961732 [Erythranthe guttata]|eukprot:XP_012841440.1 PREDICTED: uncharacterized protein LOC105961732 [Erythranthe guttata]